jgi:hypothetical protein
MRLIGWSMSNRMTRAACYVPSEMRNHKQCHTEIDITCWRDGELFVFECKNAYPRVRQENSVIATKKLKKQVLNWIP